MRHRRIDSSIAQRLSWGLISTLLMLISAFPAQGQCSSGGTWSSQNVETRPESPLQVEVAQFVIRSLPDGTRSANEIWEKISRDSKGRVRVDRYMMGGRPVDPWMHTIVPGDFDGVGGDIPEPSRKETPDQSFMDDPCTGKHLVFEASKQTVKISKVPLGPPASAQALCTDPDPNHPPQPAPMGIYQYLGHRQFLGAAAFGMRKATYASLEDKQLNRNPVDSAESWCSDEIGASLAIASHHSASRLDVKVVVRRLTRTEPDPALFEIPAGYHVIEQQANQ